MKIPNSLLALAAIFPATAFAADGTWTSNVSGGNWSDGGNWFDGTVAGSGGIADLSTVDLPAGAFSVVLDAPVNLSQLLLGDSDTATEGSWSIGGAEVLTLSGLAAINASVNSTISAQISGTAGLAKSGAGNLTISNGSNNYSGGTTLSAGTLILGSNANFGTGGIGTGTITFNGGTLSHGYSSGNTLVYTEAMDVAAGGGTLIAPNRFRLNSAISGSGTLNLQVLSGVSRSDFQNNWSAFTGRVNISGSGEVRLGVNALGSGQPTFNASGWGNNHVDLAGTVSIVPTTNSGGNTITIGALSGASSTTKLLGGTAGAATWSVGALGTDTTFNGAIEGQALLTKVGDGTLTLGGANTYTGATTVSAGTLLVSGSLGNTAVSVGNGATVGGDGIIAGSLDLASGARFLFDETSTLTVNGASVTFGGFSIANISGLDSSTANGTYTLIDGQADIDFTNVANIGEVNAYDLGDGKSAYFQEGSLQLVVIPEPATALLGALGMLGFSAAADEIVRLMTCRRWL